MCRAPREAAAQRHQCCTLLILTPISWRSHCPKRTGKPAERKVRSKCPGRAQSLAWSRQPLLELLGAHIAAGAGPQAGEPAQDQLSGCVQGMNRATVWQSSRAAFYFYCFLQLAFLFPKQKQSVQDQWLYLSGNGDFCAAHPPTAPYTSLVFPTVSLVQFLIAKGSKISGLETI